MTCTDDEGDQREAKIMGDEATLESRRVPGRRAMRLRLLPRLHKQRNLRRLCCSLLVKVKVNFPLILNHRLMLNLES
jgi:hypothetical protein